jgi:hypothetical protein
VIGLGTINAVVDETRRYRTELVHNAALEPALRNEVQKSHFNAVNL